MSRTIVELRRTAEELVEELRDLPDGTEITLWQLLDRCVNDADSYEEYELMDLHDVLFRLARANRIKLDMSQHDGLEEGLLHNLEFVVYNKRAQIKCPHCGSKSTARIMYGMPCMNDAMMDKIERGKVVIGGCKRLEFPVDDETSVDISPKRRCNDCGKAFASPAYLITKDRIEAFDEIVRGVRFSCGGYFGGWADIRIKQIEGGARASVVSDTRGGQTEDGARVSVLSDTRIEQTEEGARVSVVSVPEEDTTITDRKITESQWFKLVSRLYNEMYLHEWKKSYIKKDVLDGEQWSLEIELTGRRKRTYRGSNAYPAYWTELKALFRKYLK